MSMDDDFGFALPPYAPQAALLRLAHALRAMGLAARGAGFERRGRQVAELAADGAVVRARLARRLAMTPEWDTQALQSAADERKWLDEVKKRLQRWERDDT